MTSTPDDPRIAVGTGGHRLHPATIRTGRLALVPMSVDLARSVLRQDWSMARHLLGTEFPLEWRDDGWSWLEPQADQAEHDDRVVIWGTRLALADSVDDGGHRRSVVVAEVGFHGPPDSDGWVEIGYRVIAARRREGLAEEAVRALLEWAGAAGVSGVTAAVDPPNAASIGLLRKLGFSEAGRREHKVLGEQVIFRRSAPTP